MKTTNRYLLYIFGISAIFLPMVSLLPSAQVLRYQVWLSLGSPEDKRWAIRGLRAYGAEGLSPLLGVATDPSEDPKLRARALGAIAVLGHEAAPAAPQLAALITDPAQNVRSQAASALAGIGPRGRRVLPLLIKAFAHREATVRGAAVRAVVGQGPGVFEELRPLLRSGDPKVQECAALSMGLIRYARGDSAALSGVLEIDDQEAAIIVAALAPRLKRGRYGEMIAVARALGGLEARGASAVPALLRLVEDWELIEDSCEALANIGPGASEAVPVLLKVYGSCEPYQRAHVLRALLAIGAPVDELRPILEAAARDPSYSEPGLIAVEALKKLDSGRSSVSASRSCSTWTSSGTDENSREVGQRMKKTNRYMLYLCGTSAILLLAVFLPTTQVFRCRFWLILGSLEDRRWAVARLRETGPEGVPPLMSVAMDPSEDPTLRVKALNGIAYIGQSAAPEAGALASLIGDKTPSLRDAARGALARIGPRGKAALPVLIKLFAHPKREVRSRAALAASAQGPDAFGELRALLGSPDPKVKGSAALSLGLIRAARVDSTPREAVRLIEVEGAVIAAELGPRLAQAPYDEKLLLFRALGGLEAQGKAAVPHLIPFLSSPRSAIKQASEALASIGPAASAAVPALLAAYEGNDRHHIAIIEALLAIGAPEDELRPVLEAAAQCAANRRARRISRQALKKLDKEK